MEVTDKHLHVIILAGLLALVREAGDLGLLLNASAAMREVGLTEGFDKGLHNLPNDVYDEVLLDLIRQAASGLAEE